MEDREVDVWFPNSHVDCIFLNSLSVALTSAGSAAFWLLHRLTPPHGLFCVVIVKNTVCRIYFTFSGPA
jgi:hypothetical protein